MMQLPIMRQGRHEPILTQMLGVEMSRVKVGYGSYIRSHKQGWAKEATRPKARYYYLNLRRRRERRAYGRDKISVCYVNVWSRACMRSARTPKTKWNHPIESVKPLLGIANHTTHCLDQTMIQHERKPLSFVQRTRCSSQVYLPTLCTIPPFHIQISPYLSFLRNHKPTNNKPPIIPLPGAKSPTKSSSTSQTNQIPPLHNQSCHPTIPPKPPRAHHHQNLTPTLHHHPLRKSIPNQIPAHTHPQTLKAVSPTPPPVTNRTSKDSGTGAPGVKLSGPFFVCCSS